MGPSGCGKSPLLNIMGLLDAATSGTIKIAGTVVEGMKDKELAAFRNKNLGFVFQSFHLINSLNVIDNVELPLLYRNVSAKERRQLAEEVLKKGGLSHRMRHMPSQLSGGQCQRVAIARALALTPDVLCFDEPTSALDPELTGEVLKVIRGLKSGDRTMIVVTHEMEFARKVADKVIFIADGVIEEEGTPEEVFDFPKSEKMKNFLRSKENKEGLYEEQPLCETAE